MVELKNAIGEKLNKKINSISFNVDGYLDNFTSMMELENIKPFEFKKRLKGYIEYQNGKNSTFNISIEFKNDLNYEIRVDTWRTVGDGDVPKIYDLTTMYVFYYVNIYRKNGWKYNYENIVITDKNGEVIEDLT